MAPSTRPSRSVRSVRACPRIQKIIHVKQPRGDQHRRSLPEVLGLPLQLGSDGEERDPDRDADRDRGENAHPDGEEAVTAARARKEREDDAHDERCLEPLSQDQQTCAQRRSSHSM